MLDLPIFIITATLFTLGYAAVNSSNTGNCYTGRITLDSTRMIPLYGSSSIATRLSVDVSKYDMALDTGSIEYFNPRGITMNLKRGPDGKGIITSLSTTRYILYGRFTARIKSSPIPGIITTFITMSSRGDEIDWEIIGARPGFAESNVFYKGIKEMGIHGKKHPIESAHGIADYHDYTIDWKPDVLTYAVDGTIVRIHRRDGAESQSPMTPPGEEWYPSTPSLVQISIWDGGSVGGGVSNWAGGEIPWTSANLFNSSLEYLDIYCYNNNGNLASKWPMDNTVNPVRSASISTGGFGISWIVLQIVVAMIWKLITAFNL
ncbi:hypothetical protein BATDEDRAFT_22780 [Batrachochytrium dendrobatidis JAM81]|uniref:GH16 domain-containing protein n=2 Tax=Batrachochytrium dendrobatidis TaxID=109871 RepID=F4NXJ4_BATDJ|nr:uncharacterized protein BATDEDRAFT_22780 [Batrachochytrium dendrobatidis JAM81]EGF82696.1 hypothetical protein BATDEDRAFT_22780 [Batrachochytrium dendrobatidis JAM81]OAJ39858.1 hypothetical protein BDEG_23662 [Batrachochytrium dendrobatidis JEL423]|eukprot:XP_006676623.1 hypothetical protein BATDEDRAFT_22780 [Batrachochytrium dendrobatidis JAM81]